MNKENKVLDDLKEKTFEHADEEHVFDTELVVGTTLDDSIGIMLSASEGADKMVLQIGEQTIPLSPQAFLFLTKSVNLLAAIVASKGPNGFTELLERETEEDIAGDMNAFIHQEHEGELVWIKAADVNSVTEGLLPKRAIMTDRQKKRHSDVLDSLLTIEESHSKEEEEFTEEEQEEEDEDSYDLGEEEIGLDDEEDFEFEDEDEEEDFEDSEEEGEEEADPEKEGFIERMKTMEKTLTGAFEIQEEEEPSFEKIAEIKGKYGELAAREYVESLTQEQKEELVRKRLEAKAVTEQKPEASPEDPTQE